MGKHRDKFAEDLALRGMAARTCELYLRAVEAFIAHRGRGVDELGTEDVRDWLLFLLRKRQLKPATVNNAISSLRAFFTSLGRPEVMRSIRGVRNHHHAPDILSGSEVHRLL
jgi:site-specific recombinase XerD